MNNAIRNISVAVLVAASLAFLGGCGDSAVVTQGDLKAALQKQKDDAAKEKSEAAKKEADAPKVADAKKAAPKKKAPQLSHLPPGSWNGKTSPTGPASAPRVKHSLSPSEKPCAEDGIRYKNGCAKVVESTYFNEDGVLTTVKGMPRNKKGQVSHFTQTMQFAWRNCKNLEVRLEPARKGIDADFHILCPDEL